MLNKASEACDMLSRHIKEEHVIRIVSHNDADGLSAAGLIAKAITEEGGQFHTTIVPRLKAEIVKELAHERYELFIFSDMGSACLDYINRLKADVIIADHHQPNETEKNDENSDNENTKSNINANVVHVNPHIFGINGTTEISGAGTSYLTVRDLGEGKKHLAPLALVGAFGDMQGQDGFIGVNKVIVEDGKEAGSLEIHEDLKIVSKTQEPLYKSLAYTFSPSLPGLTGDLEGSIGFLEKAGLSYGIKFSDLEDEEKDVLKDELLKLNPKIFGDVYSIPKENPILRNLEEYSSILDSCGKNKKTGLGLSIVLGERGEALDVAIKFQTTYREQLIKGMEWIKREGSTQLESIQYIYSDDKVLKSVMGTISSVGISVGLLVEDKPILSMARMHNDVKVSGRTTKNMVKKGVDLGKALHDSSLSFGGQGGGHDIAAGAMIPYKEMDNFLNLVNDMVEYQINAKAQ
ncbi:DHH family phosphoesterase [Methanobrevibacter cuticularis]|uniref:DHH family phosphoesterase n=1 Tax=Methanobrevibacter cuticularis TaxID=47311 RepID=UPI0009FC52BF|nr:DHH family phosphoesterase [Methanobrevibacter cuticularis]